MLMLYLLNKLCITTFLFLFASQRKCKTGDNVYNLYTVHFTVAENEELGSKNVGDFLKLLYRTKLTKQLNYLKKE